MNSEHSPEDLQQIYRARFAERAAYRQEVWAILSHFFSQWIAPDSAVLDLGCGWCEFINSAVCRLKLGMDLNPDARQYANPGVAILPQDCSAQWAVENATLDVVFTSNFLEHLPAKSALERTLHEAFRALKPNGKFIAMGPNIKHVPGAYWDFFDHHLPLTELSLGEVLEKCGFQVELQRAQFLPYTMSRGRQYPAWMLRVYLSMPFFWRLAGAQFLVVARKPLVAATQPQS
jgi:SAM-dependent methyltransferase